MPTKDKKPAVLLTGFGPFLGIAENASAVLVPRLGDAAQRRFPDYQIVSEVLPTEWDAGPARLAALLDEHRPVVAVHFGVSERVQGFQIERTARNLRSFVIDACGALPDAECVADGGPAALAATFPAELIVARLAALHLPAAISDDAGTYLCNEVLYRSLSHCSGADSAVGFVHIPARLGEEDCALSWDAAVRGGVEIIATCLEMTPARVG